AVCCPRLPSPTPVRAWRACLLSGSIASAMATRWRNAGPLTATRSNAANRSRRDFSTASGAAGQLQADRANRRGSLDTLAKRRSIHRRFRGDVGNTDRIRLSSRYQESQATATIFPTVRRTLPADRISVGPAGRRLHDPTIVSSARGRTGYAPPKPDEKPEGWR